MPKQIICMTCQNMKTPLGRCLTCEPVNYYRKLPKRKAPKRTPTQVRTNKNRRLRYRKHELLWRAIEILLLIDEVLERDPNGEIVLYADKQKLAAEVKDVVLPFMLHTRSLYYRVKVDNAKMMTFYSKECLGRLRERLKDYDNQKPGPKTKPVPKAKDILGSTLLE